MATRRPLPQLLARYAALVQGICKAHGFTMALVCQPGTSRSHGKARRAVALALKAERLTSGEIGAILCRHYTTAQYLYGAHDHRIPQRRQRARDHKAKRKGADPMSKTENENKAKGETAPVPEAYKNGPKVKIVARPVKINRGTETEQQQRTHSRNDVVRDAQRTAKSLNAAQRQLQAITALVSGDADEENQEAQFFIIGVALKPTEKEPAHCALEDGIWFSQAAALEHFEAHRGDYSKAAGVHGFKGRSGDFANLLALTE